MLPVLDLAKIKIKEFGIIPEKINFTFIPYDDRCDAGFSSISAIDGYSRDCGHLILGPSCDYALGIQHFIIS